MILNSGEKYDQASVEFRLAFLHYERKNEYQRRNDAQMADMLSFIFCAVGISKITDESRKKIMDIARDEKDRLFNLMSLVGEKPEIEKEKRQREENHLAGQQAYAGALASLGKFGSFDQLSAAISALNETIQNSMDQNATDRKDNQNLAGK